MAKRVKKLKISSGAMGARAKFEEAKHKRDVGGKFADKPGTETGGVQGGAGTGTAPKAQWEASAKASGVVGTDKIKLHVSTNPKKAGSASAERFAKYKDGITADEFIAAGGTREDLAWDRKKGFITIHDEPTYAKLSGQAGKSTAEIAEEGATGRLASIKNSVEKPPATLAEAAASPGTAPQPAAIPEKPKAPAAAEVTDKFSPEHVMQHTITGDTLTVGEFKSRFMPHLNEEQLQQQLKGMVGSGKFEITAPGVPLAKPASSAKPTPVKSVQYDAPEAPTAVATKQGAEVAPSKPVATTRELLDDDVVEVFGKPMTVKEYGEMTSGSKEYQKDPAGVRAKLRKWVDQGQLKLIDRDVAAKAVKAKQDIIDARKTEQAEAMKMHVSTDDDGRWKEAHVVSSVSGARIGAVSASLQKGSDLSEGYKGKPASDKQMSDMNAADEAMGLKYVSKDDNFGVQAYVRNEAGYARINGGLRDEGFDKLSPNTKKEIEALDGLMEETKADVFMWRGIKGEGIDVKNLNNMPPPSEFEDMGFASMSHNPAHSLRLFSGKEAVSGATATTQEWDGMSALFKVRVPKGTQAASVGFEKNKADAMADEAEVIVARGTRFKYINSEISTVAGKKVRVIEVEVVQNNGSAIKPVAATATTSAAAPKPFTAEGDEFGGFGSGKIPKGATDSPVPNPLYKEGNGWVTQPNAIKDAGKGKLEMMTETVDVPVKKLEAWQGAVNKTANFKPLPPDGEYAPIEVYKVGGKYIIKEGNHRATAAYIEGRDTIKAKVLDLDAPENKKYINSKYNDKVTGAAVKPMKAPEGEKITDVHVTAAKPSKAVEMPQPKPLDYRYKSNELTQLPHDRMADESDKGLEWEYTVEYKKYGGEKWGPGINSQADFNKRYKAAPLTYLNDEQYNTLGYTSIDTNNLPTFNDVHKMIGHRRDPKAIRDRMFNGVTTPPIVLRKNGKLRLMAGQSRIFTGFASGFRVPVKVLDV